MDKALEILRTNGLKATTVRVGLLSIFLSNDKAISSHDIEEQLQDIDRVTLYRTLKSFQEKGIIHRAFDGTDTAKYASCSEGCSVHAHVDEHIHFHCLKCVNTFCVDGIIVPNFTMPEGFKASKTNVVVEGMCKSCQQEIS